MQKPKSPKPRVRARKVLGRQYHVYRVQDEAEDKAYDIAERRPDGWADGDMELRDCTSVRMADGSREFCNALKAVET